MPKIYRAMKRDEDGLPLVGRTCEGLGVVPGDPPMGDIPVDDDGNVAPNTGGLSVAPSWRNLPPGRIPRRLRPVFGRARGSNRYCGWVIGDGEFEDGAIDAGLFFRRDKPTHGVVEPEQTTTFDDFQTCIAATREQWQVIPEDQ